MPQPLTWTKLPQQGATKPIPRTGTSLVTIGKSLHIMFGGLEGFYDIQQKKSRQQQQEKETINEKELKPQLFKVGPSNQTYVLQLFTDYSQWKLINQQGDIPKPRVNHAACAISDSQMLVFGGQYTSKLRFNDTYVLKTSTWTWFQPPNQKSQGDPTNSESKIGGPPPISHHSAVYFEGKVYIFGGHGGVMYERKSYNDLYSLNTETWEWELIQAQGTPPDPRGGHQATLLANQNKMLIFGGWSFNSQFSNLMIYDIGNNTWMDPEISHVFPKWNLCGVMAPSIPSWKYFIFGGSVGSFEEGGNRTNSRFVDDVWCMDVDSLEWQPVELQKVDNQAELIKPLGRENPGVIYDQTESRFIIYGGWSNKWLDDIWSLNVATITGPPYAIFKIHPSQGPLTGNQKIKIFGDGFKQSNIVVRFTFTRLGKTNITEEVIEDVFAEFVSEQQINCNTPTFEIYGPRQVEVTVSINKGDFTITKASYTYYLNTKAENSIVFGPGLLNENAIGVDTVFVIQARNKDNKNRETGGDEFHVSIIRPDLVKEEDLAEKAKDSKGKSPDKSFDAASRTVTKSQTQNQNDESNVNKGDLSGIDQEEEEKKNEEYEEQLRKEEEELRISLDPSRVKFKIIDKDDGSYHVVFQQPVPCAVNIEIKFKNEKGVLVPIRGNPYTAKFIENVDPKNNELNGPMVMDHIANNLKTNQDFINEAKQNIDIRNKDVTNSLTDLIVVMQWLQKIADNQTQELLNLDIIEETLRFFEKIEIIKDNEKKKCNKLQEEWKNLTRMLTAVDKDIQGPKKQESERTKEKIGKFEEELKLIFHDLKKEQFFNFKSGFEKSVSNIREVRANLGNKDKQLHELMDLCQIFEFPEQTESCQKQFENIHNELRLYEKLWIQINQCEIAFEGYLKQKWEQVDSNVLEDDVKRLRKGLLDIKSIDRKTNVFQGIQEQMKKWNTFLPLMTELKDQSMKVEDDRHWQKMKVLLKKEFSVDENLILQEVWDFKLYEYKDGIEEITDQAKQELKMEKQLNLIINFWKDIEFELIQHKNTNIHTLKLTEENFESLEEHQLNINNMLLSKYIAYYEKLVEKWKQDLGAIYDVVQLLSEVQKTWSFLENLFIQSEEVKRELPNESKAFIGIDKDMKDIMEQGVKIKNCLQFCTQPGLLKQIEKIEKDLKVCEKALNEFLDSKRRAFPRFYFVSVNDLLDILSNGNSPAKINRHMSKIFQAIEKLTLKEAGERPDAIEMISCVGSESVKFTKVQPLQGKVEAYLKDVVGQMNSTLKDIAISSFQAIKTMERRLWIERDPAQITLVVNMILWSSAVEECFQKLATGQMDVLKNFLNTSIEKLTDLIKMVQGKLDKSMRQKVMCLITLDAHSRDVVIRLIDESVRKIEEFQWQSQLKFYFNQEYNSGQIRIADAAFLYNYEYLGNGPRLVITPLTDRIYVTATQALHLKMGCAPAGPAGTGKTETTKDLSNAVAKACYVFNCSSEMNYESMGNIYKGLASSGCWGCFDEFNRLLPETLSVCSVQFKCITDAIKRNAKRFIIEGDEIDLDKTCGVFITMNPGYLGRAELPEGLKTLFRPITVVVPDIELICENMLMAEGFVSAKLLAKKFVTLYSLCRDLLSKQLHYDWGLRAIKSVLVVAGGFKRAEPDILEQALLMRALRDFNIPKVAFQDLHVFFGLLGDLFPGINIPRKRDMRFEGVIEECCKESKLYSEPEFILKIVQLSELLEIRHCVFIMGPPGSGKSKTWQILAKAQDKDGRKTIFVDIDPKVVSTKDFYGYNLPSKEWKDGLFSNKLRMLSEMTDQNPKWMVMDGDLDTNWIESMNSVMDDNKILTLANNERIPLKPHMRCLYEIRDLRFASPATVSRAGILYISDDSGHQWQSYIKQWIESEITEVETKKQLIMLFDKYVRDTLMHIRKTAKMLAPVSQMGQVIAICKALQPLLKEEVKNLEYIFVYALVWAVAGCLGEKDGIDYRKEFSSWWKQAWKTQVKFPSKGTIFEYYVDHTGETIKFSEWSNRLQSIEFDPSLGEQMGNITVPTIETLATTEFIKNFIFVKHPSLMIGAAGCGKTQLAKGILKEIVQKKPDSFAYQLINFNYYTDASYLQSQLEQVLEKKAGRQFGPPGKVNMIYFIDDLNMPKLDIYDTQNAIALLRQHADYGHWYDISKLSLKDIINTQVLAAMNPFAGSFFVNPRYQRHFWTTTIPFPDNESLSLIYMTFLNGQLKKFKASIQEYASLIVRTTLQLHQLVSACFKKTSINFHYEFNLRHISNIFQGLLLSDPTKFQEPERFIKLFIHEAERTYGDRLVNYDHLKIYRENMFDIIKKSFSKFNLSRYFHKDHPEILVFCNFTAGITADRFYCEMPNDKLEYFITDALREYNDNFAFMGLVLFEDALKHVTRICRIVLPPSGHALLVGVGGSGKQSLSKLSSFIMSYNIFSITISTTYSMFDLRTDLQNLFQKCGPKEEPYMFLFTEGQITNERFLVYINDLLSSGEIAELYNLDEKEVIINAVRTKVKGEGKVDTRENCWNWFIDSIKRNLHMSICFSPVGDMRRRARQFPALINCTVIDWFQPWPYDALYNVAKQFLAEDELGDDNIRNAIVEFMPYSFTLVNDLGVKLLEQERRYAYTTPKSFLELIALFQSMLTAKRKRLDEGKERYERGLVKLRHTAEQVAIIELEVKEKQIEAESKKKESEAFAAVVDKEKTKVEKENAKATIEAENCATIKTDVEQKKSDTQRDLDNAIPLVEKAKEALNSIQKKDFQTAKSWSNPPSGVPEVFAATQYLLGGFWNEAIDVDKNKKPKNVEWKYSLKMMKNPEEFMQKLISFKDTVDQNLVHASNVKFVKDTYLKMDSFNGEAMAQKSGAAKGVCEWVINIVLYYDVIQDVEPKRKALKEATEKLEEATTKLQEVEEVVRLLNEQLAELTAQFNGAVDAKNKAIAEADRCARRLSLAQRLIKALGSENERWAASIIQLDFQLQLIVGDVLMASSFVSYAGPFNKKFRNIMINEKFLKYIIEKKIPMSPNPNPVKLLTDDSTIALWNKQQLPTDQVSIENGTILTNSERYPLMIDPQLQGICWIREKEKSNDLKSLRLGSKNLNRGLEHSIEMGIPALIENMGERIEAILMPVIARQFTKRGNKKIIKFAGKDLVLSDKFRLYLQTKLSNPHYPPEIQAEAVLINFTVTEVGLADQLLALVVLRERPDLAAKRVQLINQQNDFKIKLKQLEDEVLEKLANATGDILEDISLIENLEYSKKLSNEVNEKVAKAIKTEIKINETSERYRPAAVRGALFYFMLSDLPKIHTFYKYSLESFIIVINRAIDQISENKLYGTDFMIPYNEEEEKIQKYDDNENEEEILSPTKKKAEETVKSKQVDEEEQKQEEEEYPQQEEEDDDEGGLTPRSLNSRVNALIESLTYNAYQYTRRGLFERHKLIIATMLTFRILLKDEKLNQDEIDHLVIGKVDANPYPMPEALKSFITEQIWQAVSALQVFPVFNQLGYSLETDVLQWKKWYQDEKAETLDLPKSMKDCSKFHKLMLLRAIRPDRLTSALSTFISESMGERYIEQPPFNMKETFEETTKFIPVFFVLFPGVDPTPDVESVGKLYDISSTNGRFINISMGQGQEDKAKKALFNCAKKGYWIMLQNLHLMQSWVYGINGLEGFLEEIFNSPKTHKNFRLFLSSEPPPIPSLIIIPESVLQASLKISNEAPQYLKANLRRAYAKFDQEYIDKCTKKPNEFKSCLFALCFFHAQIIGRKKFGSQGWSRVYNFNDGDLTICADVLHNYLSKYDVTPYDDLRYIFGEIMYGGHITDNWDRRTNRTYLEVLIRQELMQNNYQLAPLFRIPDPQKFDYQKYKNFIDQNLPPEVPQVYGMHPNAEIGYLNNQCQDIFSTILEVQAGSGSGGSKQAEQGLVKIIDEFLDRRPKDFQLLTINERVKEKTPFVVVALQELERMNELLDEIKKSLEELKLGLTGALNMTDQMEVLSQSLQFNRVPGTWASKAYYSKKNLAIWFADLIERNIQLQNWSQELETPKSLCISYLFNPMSFVTAIMQFIARQKGLPLDNMAIQTDVTFLKGVEEVQKSAEVGAYVHGLYLEGAAWELGQPGQEGYLIDQKPKELHPKMPVVNIIAVPTDKKKKIGQYECPSYVTSDRGITFVFAANLNMESEDSDPKKWILSGTCLLMSDD